MTQQTIHNLEMPLSELVALLTAHAQGQGLAVPDGAETDVTLDGKPIAHNQTVALRVKLHRIDHTQ